jgi:quinol-cytochrome oxidoreductase complex cytochrome b subunit
MHNVRLMWLKSAAPELLERQEKIEKEQSENKAHLLNSLSKSGAAIAVLLGNALVMIYQASWRRGFTTILFILTSLVL